MLFFTEYEMTYCKWGLFPFVLFKMRERCEVREAATATKRNVVKRSEEAGVIAEHWT